MERELGSDKRAKADTPRIRRPFTRNTVIMITLFIFMVLAIGVPTVIVWLNPDTYGPPTQVLFDVVLAGISIVLGLVISTRQAEKRATDLWIPAAESASRALLTMDAIVQRMRHKQGQVCGTLEPLLSDISEEKLVAIKAVLKTRCDACSDGLSNLGFQIRNSFGDWDTYIETNCDEDVCVAIHNRLDEKREELARVVKRDFPDLDLT